MLAQLNLGLSAPVDSSVEASETQEETPETAMFLGESTAFRPLCATNSPRLVDRTSRPPFGLAKPAVDAVAMKDVPEKAPARLGAARAHARQRAHLVAYLHGLQTCTAESSER